MIPVSITRRKLLYSALGAGLAGSYACLLEPRWLEATERCVTFPGNSLRQPIRALHVSDLHFSIFVPIGMIEHAVSVGLGKKPDVICLTGDFITHREDVGTGGYSRVLRRLSAAAPTFAVLGNHDGGRWARERRGYGDHRAIERLLDESNVALLHNRSARVRIRDEDLTLVGVGDLWSGEIDAGRAFSGTDGRSPVVLLSHNPDSKDVLGAWRWDLMLSGHTHGGQVIWPFDGPRYAPVADKRYVAGLKPWRDRQIHVTRGVGNLGGVRVRCRPEVSLLVLG